MISVRGRGSAPIAHPRRLERQFAAIDRAGLAFGAADRDDRAVLSRSVAPSAPDHRRHAEFAGDDRRVAGAAATAGDDRRGGLHDRLPIGARRLGDQHLARAEGARSARIGDHAATAPEAIFSPTARPVTSTGPVPFSA